MKKFIKTTALFASAVIIVTLAACSSSPEGTSEEPVNADCVPVHDGLTTMKDGVLDVSVYVSPPYSTEEAGEFGGIDVAIITELAEMECLDLQLSPVAGSALVAGIQAGRVDLGLGGVKYTPERAETLALSIPMYQDGVAFLSTEQLDGTLAGLGDGNVGIIQGYFFTDDLVSALGADRVSIYQDAASMLADVKNKRIVAGTLDAATAAYHAANNPEFKSAPIVPTTDVPASMQKNKVVLAGYPGQPELMAALNENIKAMIADGRIGDILKANNLDPADAGGTV